MISQENESTPPVSQEGTTEELPLTILRRAGILAVGTLPLTIPAATTILGIRLGSDLEHDNDQQAQQDANNLKTTCRDYVSSHSPEDDASPVVVDYSSVPSHVLKSCGISLQNTAKYSWGGETTEDVGKITDVRIALPTTKQIDTLVGKLEKDAKQFSHVDQIGYGTAGVFFGVIGGMLAATKGIRLMEKHFAKKRDKTPPNTPAQATVA